MEASSYREDRGSSQPWDGRLPECVSEVVWMGKESSPHVPEGPSSISVEH